MENAMKPWLRLNRLQFPQSFLFLLILGSAVTAKDAFVDDGERVIEDSYKHALPQNFHAKAFADFRAQSHEGQDRANQQFHAYEEKEEEKNCTERSIHDFPNDLFNKEERKKGAVILHAFFGVYCFLLTAYVCNDYLLPSLDCICAGMRISADVAGATFLATASCFPELFVSLVGTFLTESDLGVGTVMGGAVFNTFATPACGALFASQGIPLEWKILTRDCAIYILSVGALVAVMWDGLITWYEATAFVLLFLGYLILLFCGKSINGCAKCWCRKVSQICTRHSSNMNILDRQIPAAGAVGAAGAAMPIGLYKPYVHSELAAEYATEYRKSINANSPVNGIRYPSNCEYALDSVQDDGDAEVEVPESLFVWPKDKSIPRKAWFLFTWPIKLILFLTIPDCRFRALRKWYPATFLICVIWIAVASYLVSWMTTVVGDTLGIADSIMGITFLSAGGNMPELVSIVILSKKGNGDMAMSNTLGANTLDILLCLGLPWIIKIAVTGRNVEIISGALSYSVLSILPCVLAFYLMTAIYKFRLNRQVGLICLILYAIFLILAISIEMNVFFFVNLPMCET